jgi:hypothetical protein
MCITNRYLNVVVSCLLIWISAACAVKSNLPVCIKDGKNYSMIKGAFRDRWFNFYEMGISYMEGQCYESALWAFQQAINRIPEDMRDARKTDIHYIDYFPHRESGIVYYLLGKDQQAIDELELSVFQESSAKALFYLDKVRTRCLKKKQLSGVPSLLLPETDIITNADPVWLTGIAKDPLYIKSVWVGNKHVIQESAQKEIHFAEPLYLIEGNHTCPLTITNLLDRQTVKQINILIDRSGPLISIIDINESVKGELSDNTCNQMLFYANEQKINIPKGKNVPFEIKIQPDQFMLELLAEDTLGNQTKIIIPLKNTMQSLAIKQLWADISGTNLFLPQLTPFTVIIHGCQDGQVVYSDRINISVQVFSDDEIAKISLNHTDLHHSNGKICIFNRTIPLHMGDNRIRLIVHDIQNRQYQRTLHLHRKQSTVWKLAHRFGIHASVLKGQTDSQLYHYFHKKFWKEMTNQKRFYIENDAKLSALLSEPEPFKQPERITRSHAFFKGVIFERREGVEIGITLFNNNSQTIKCIDIYDEYQSMKSDRFFAYQLAKHLSEKIHYHFPLIDGNVHQFNKQLILMYPETDLQKIDRIPSNWPVIIYKKEMNGHDNILGYSSVSGKEQKIIKILNNSNVRVSMNDRIIMQ